MHLPTSLTMPLPLPLHTTSTCQIHWCWSRACVGPQEWVDPMLEELAASLVVSWPAGAPVPGCPSTTTTAPPVSMTRGEQPDVMEAEARPDSSNTLQVRRRPPLAGHRTGNSPTSSMSRRA
jgi:hypothetical protein